MLSPQMWGQNHRGLLIEFFFEISRNLLGTRGRYRKSGNVTFNQPVEKNIPADPTETMKFSAHKKLEELPDVQPLPILELKASFTWSETKN